MIMTDGSETGQQGRAGGELGPAGRLLVGTDGGQGEEADHDRQPRRHQHQHSAPPRGREPGGAAPRGHRPHGQYADARQHRARVAHIGVRPAPGPAEQVDTDGHRRCRCDPQPPRSATSGPPGDTHDRKLPRLSGYGVDSFDRQSSLGYQVNHLARLLARALREEIEQFGVSPGQFAQLLTLYEDDSLTQAELCERVQIEQPTMARTLARMERDGLVERHPDPRDARRSLVCLTDSARARRSDLVGAATSVNGTATRGLDQAAVAAFMVTMSTLIDNLQAAATDPPESRPAPRRRRSAGRAVA